VPRLTGFAPGPSRSQSPEATMSPTFPNRHSTHSRREVAHRPIAVSHTATNPPPRFPPGPSAPFLAASTTSFRLPGRLACSGLRLRSGSGDPAGLRLAAPAAALRLSPSAAAVAFAFAFAFACRLRLSPSPSPSPSPVAFVFAFAFGCRLRLSAAAVGCGCRLRLRLLSGAVQAPGPGFGAFVHAGDGQLWLASPVVAGPAVATGWSARLAGLAHGGLDGGLVGEGRPCGWL
jgi:hypothetical protein